MTQVIGKGVGKLERALAYEAQRLANDMAEAEGVSRSARSRMLADAVVFFQARMEQVLGEDEGSVPRSKAAREEARGMHLAYPKNKDGSLKIMEISPVAEEPEDLAFLD